MNNTADREHSLHDEVQKLALASTAQGAHLTALTTQVQSLAQSIEKIGAAVQLRGRISPSSVTAIATVASLGAGLLVFAISAFVSNSTSPLLSRLDRVDVTQHAHDEQIGRILDAMHEIDTRVSSSAMADAQSRIDRAQINDRVKTIEQRQSDNLADRKGETGALAERFAKVETQFQAEDKIRNIQFAEQMRFFGLIWPRLYPGVPFPSVTYFPEMAQTATPPVLGK
jgi:hypothetical protein